MQYSAVTAPNIVLYIFLYSELHSSALGSAGVHEQLLVLVFFGWTAVEGLFLYQKLVRNVFFGWTAVEALFLYQKLVRNVLGEVSHYFIHIAAAVVWCKWNRIYMYLNCASYSFKGLKRTCNNSTWSFNLLCMHSGSNCGCWNISRGWLLPLCQ